MAVSMKPRLVGVSCLKRATRVRSISSTEICLPMTSSISCGRPAAEALYHGGTVPLDVGALRPHPPPHRAARVVPYLRALRSATREENMGRHRNSRIVPPPPWLVLLLVATALTLIVMGSAAAQPAPAGEAVMAWPVTIAPAW